MRGTAQPLCFYATHEAKNKHISIRRAATEPVPQKAVEEVEQAGTSTEGHLKNSG
jgi:hypothetical protein